MQMRSANETCCFGIRRTDQRCHDATRELLQLEFRDGAVYQYFDVAAAIYESLLQAGGPPHRTQAAAHFRRLSLSAVFSLVRQGSQAIAPKNRADHDFRIHQIHHSGADQIVNR